MMGNALNVEPASDGAEALQELEAHLQSELIGRVRDLRLIRRDEGLVLRGLTHTYHAKQLVLSAVLKASPLPVVANEIEVH
jgi:hypothetical protein